VRRVDMGFWLLYSHPSAPTAPAGRRMGDNMPQGGRHSPRYRIADLDRGDRPRERLAAAGPTVLGNAELVAILLRTGLEGINAVELARAVPQEAGGLAGLHRIDCDTLCGFRGIGPAKAAQLKAAIELGRRLATAEAEEQPVIQSPEDAAGLVAYEMGALEQEQLRVLLLDTLNTLIRQSEVYLGSLNAASIRVGEVFKDAVRANAAAILVVHNHPSGNPSPSPEDVALTRALVEGGRLLDIEVLDHLVIGGNRHISLKSGSLGFA
jgi:DNA repair protein RadC